MEPIDLYIGGRLRLARVTRGYSRKGLAAQVGMSEQQLEKIETGQGRLFANRAWQFSQVLGIDPGWLFEGFSIEAGGPAADAASGAMLPPLKMRPIVAETVQLILGLSIEDQDLMREVVRRFSRAADAAAAEGGTNPAADGDEGEDEN